MDTPSVRFRTPPLLRIRQAVRRRLVRAKHYWQERLIGESVRTYFDLHQLQSLNALLTSHHQSPLSADAKCAEDGVDGAARFLLGSLAANRRLRRRFPQALTQGREGPFAQWAMQAVATDAARANIRQAFTSGFNLRGEKILALRHDLRREFPLALTPAQRGQFLQWYLHFGYETDASLLDLLWHLFVVDESPDRGLSAMFLLQPDWQARFPHALTVFGWEAFKRWISQQYGLRCNWLRRARLALRERPWDEIVWLFAARPELRTSFPGALAARGDASAIADWLMQQGYRLSREWRQALAEDFAAHRHRQQGVNVLSLFSYPSGIQQAAQDVVNALAHRGIPTVLRDMPTPHRRELWDRSRWLGRERYGVSLIITGLDTAPRQAYQKAGLHPLPGTYRIAQWWWELETPPEGFESLAEQVDEIWAPTTFIAQALKSAGKPVIPMLPGVSLPSFTPRSKEQLGLSPGKFTFLFVFDMNSRMPRKNPLGLIRAFRLAFQPREPVELVIKVSPQEEFYASWWQELREQAQEADVKLIDRAMTRAEVLALMNAADAYVSLHRSEGFGLTLAEAMLLGKPTIATAYSGNRDFMNPGNSYLVNFDRVRLEESVDPYPRGAVWAEPDVHHAAMLMSRVYDHPAEAKAVGARAQAEVATLLSLAAAGERMARRLEEIRLRSGP